MTLPEQGGIERELRQDSDKSTLEHMIKTWQDLPVDNILLRRYAQENAIKSAEDEIRAIDNYLIERKKSNPTEYEAGQKKYEERMKALGFSI